MLRSIMIICFSYWRG